MVWLSLHTERREPDTIDSVAVGQDGASTTGALLQPFSYCQADAHEAHRASNAWIDVQGVIRAVDVQRDLNGRRPGRGALLDRREVRFVHLASLFRSDPRSSRSTSSDSCEVRARRPRRHWHLPSSRGSNALIPSFSAHGQIREQFAIRPSRAPNRGVFTPDCLAVPQTCLNNGADATTGATGHAA